MSRLLTNLLASTLLMLVVNVAYSADAREVKTISVVDVPTSGPGSFANMVELYCMKYALIEWQHIITILREMEATPYPLDSYFQTAACQPDGYGDDVKSPIAHVVADDTCKREKFLNMMWLYYTKKRNDPTKFTEILNARNTRGETLLDYLESQRVRDKYNEELQESADKIIAFACSHGAKYSTYPNKTCP